VTRLILGNSSYSWDSIDTRPIGARFAGAVTATLTDPLSFVTASTMDLKGRMLQQLAPDGGLSSWTRDAAGRRQEKGDAAHCFDGSWKRAASPLFQAWKRAASPLFQGVKTSYGYSQSTSFCASIKTLI
jgi:hypothetical protein